MHFHLCFDSVSLIGMLGILHDYDVQQPGLEIRGILVANATMFCHLLPGFSCGSKHLLLP